MIDVCAAYQLDLAGGDNVTKLQALAADVDQWFKAGKPLPKLVFPTGEVHFSHWPNLVYPNLQIVADGQCKLVHTGSGNAVELDGSIIGPGQEPGVNGFQFLGFTVAPNNGDAVVITGCHRSRFDIFVDKAPNTSTAVSVKFCILGEFRVSARGGGNGVVLDSLPGNTALQTTACTFINPILESQASNGLWIKSAGACTFVGGTIESDGTAVRIDSGGHNRIFGTDIESNQTDIYTGSGAHNNTFWLSNPSSLKWGGSWDLTNRSM